MWIKCLQSSCHAISVQPFNKLVFTKYTNFNHLVYIWMCVCVDNPQNAENANRLKHINRMAFSIDKLLLKLRKIPVFIECLIVLCFVIEIWFCTWNTCSRVVEMHSNETRWNKVNTWPKRWLLIDECQYHKHISQIKERQELVLPHCFNYHFKHVDNLQRVWRQFQRLPIVFVCYWVCRH